MSTNYKGKKQMSVIIMPATAKLIAMDESFSLKQSRTSGEALLQTGAKMYPLPSGWWRICGYAEDGGDVRRYINEYGIVED